MMIFAQKVLGQLPYLYNRSEFSIKASFIAMDYRGHMILLPPSMASVCPVMKEAALEAKKAMVEATSSTVPTLPMACVVLQCSKNAWYLHSYFSTSFYYSRMPRVHVGTQAMPAHDFMLWIIQYGSTNCNKKLTSLYKCSKDNHNTRQSVSQKYFIRF